MKEVCNTCKHYDYESGNCTKKGIKMGSLDVCADWMPPFSREGVNYEGQIEAYTKPRFLTKDQLIEKE